MKKTCLLTILSLGLGMAVVNAATIKVSVSNKIADKVVLVFADKVRKEIVLNAEGNGFVTVNDFTPQYVRLQHGRSMRILYLEPNADLSVAFEGSTLWKSVSFSGEGAEVNTYLNNGQLSAMQYDDAKIDEEAYMQKTDSIYQANLSVLEASNLPDSFTEIEKQRLKYFSYGGVPLYPVYHASLSKNQNFRPTPAYYQKLKDLTVDDASLLCLNEYKDFLINATYALGLNGEKNESMEQLFNCQMKYVETNITNPDVLEYIVNTSAYNYVQGSGIDKAAPVIAMFNKYVKNSKMIEAFNKICDDWKKIATGQPSPIFCGEDVSGKTVTLNDLKGKYIYIDVWATWCGPCRGELPHLKKLEEKYNGKDIEFVSLSCDQNKEAWKKMVTSQNMKGVQLYIGNKAAFMQEYMIFGIPRFILLDKEGKIISSQMTRPSQLETAQKFDELLGNK